MTTPQLDRRRSARYRQVDEHRIVSTRIRPGHVAAVVNVSAGGALIETVRRLLPGAAVELQLERRDDRVALRGAMARCWVSRLNARCVWYRGAIVFDRELPWFLEPRVDGYPLLRGESRSGTAVRARVTPEVI